MANNVLEVLTVCHQCVADRLSILVQSVLDETDDVLFNLVQNTGSKEHAGFFEAMREIRLKRDRVESAYIDIYKNNYAKQIEVILAQPSGTTESESGFYEYVDDADPHKETGIALNSTINRVRRICKPALVVIEKNITSLTGGGIHINPESYPASPEIICRSFIEACNIIDINVDVKLVLLKVFEKQLVSMAEGLYIELDDTVSRKMEEGNSIVADDNNHVEKKIKDQITDEEKNHFVFATGEVRKQINLHLGKSIMPSFVNDFLFNHWSRLLLKIYLRGGIESNNWLRAIEVVDDLVICTGSESSLTEKKEFSEKIQYLIQRLKKGMNAISVPTGVQDGLINGLIQQHRDLTKEDTRESEPEESLSILKSNMERKDVPFFNELLIDKKRH